MAQIAPWYSIRRQDKNVYHDDDHCPVARDISDKYRMRGHRCRQRCRACARLRGPAAESIRRAELMPL